MKKLLPPLTNIIKTTPAMSLLYECINGIVQGGILEGAEGTAEGEEIARLCVGKLRSMLVVEGDPNRMFGTAQEGEGYLLTTHSQIRRSSGVSKDRHLTPASRFITPRRDFGMH